MAGTSKEFGGMGGSLQLGHKRVCSYVLVLVLAAHRDRTVGRSVESVTTPACERDGWACSRTRGHGEAAGWRGSVSSVKCWWEVASVTGVSPVLTRDSDHSKGFCAVARALVARTDRRL